MTDCTCEKCVRLCTHNPGWPTPEEVGKALAVGFASRFMLDWYSAVSEDGKRFIIPILSPASVGSEGKLAPQQLPKGQCTFLKDGLCELHHTSFKPKQCREHMACKGIDDVKSSTEVARLWATGTGSMVIAAWKQHTGFAQ